MTKILVTGANGQLAKCLKDATESLDDKNYCFLFLDKERFDISKKDLVEAYFFSNKIDYVVNCAAYTAVDKAEDEVEKAFQINADAVGLLAKECAEQGATFIHISTDYVFNGIGVEPFTEGDATQPINVYGKSKLYGERLAMKNNPNSIIIRTSWVYSQYGHNFVKTMLRLFSKKEEISVVNDQFGTPTNANDLAQAILKIIMSEKKTAGVFHYTNAGQTNWFEFSSVIKEIKNSDITIKPIPTTLYPTKAERPKYSVLNTSKIKKVYDINILNWKESLGDLLKIKLNYGE